MTAFDRIRQLLDLFRHSGDGLRHGSGKTKQQAAAIVFRGPHDRREVMLVTSRDTGRWIIPKGWVEHGEDGADAARREAFEEAGLIGEALHRHPVGRYRYIKSRPQRGDAICDVDVYLLKLIEEKSQWPEQNQRRRKWFPVATAITMIGEEDLKHVLRAAFQSLEAA